MGHQIKIEGCWTDAVTPEMKCDFMALANTVFGSFVTETYYKAKFEDNIYGPSLLSIIYVDGRPVGTDVMWRNDVCGMKAYQTVDTCVLEPYRGMGLFKKLTYWELDAIGDKALAYGYPNHNSFPGYVKMGWQVNRLYKTLSILNKDTTKLNTIDADYAKWWLKAQEGITHVENKGKYYLIRKKERSHTAVLIGRVSEDAALMFPKSKGICLYQRFETKSSIYNKNILIPLVCNQQKMEIPYWKIDAI